MSKRIALAGKHRPIVLPLQATVLVILALDFWDAPTWLWGVLITLLALVWVGSIYDVITADTKTPRWEPKQ